MPTAICCPACKRVLNLPPEAINLQVQCPACKHQFHPAEASPPEHLRPAAPKFESTSAPAMASTAAELGRPPERRSSPPLPPPSYEVRPTSRRGKRDVEDLCPACQAFVPRGVDICPECKAEFEPEDDEGYRPWEQEGLERRDSEPHRGGMLLAAGIGSLITPVFFFVCYLGILTSLLGLVVSVVVIWFSTVDLRKMANHVMNKEGAGTTSGARVCAIIGAGLNVLALIAAIALTALMP